MILDHVDQFNDMLINGVKGLSYLWLLSISFRLLKKSDIKHLLNPTLDRETRFFGWSTQLILQALRSPNIKTKTKDTIETSYGADIVDDIHANML